MFLSRILSIIILLITLLTGAVFLRHVFSVDMTPTDRSESQTLSRRDDRLEHIPEDGIATGILNRLSLFPNVNRDRSLLAVMIENHEEARIHHKGFSDALLIEEFLVEGLISRFVVLFDVRKLPSLVGPVRSLRPYFIDGILPWANTILHAGGSPEALERVKNDSAISSFNGLSLPDHFLRDEDVAAPHNLFIAKKHILDLVDEDALKQTVWPPYRIGAVGDGSGASVIRVNFFNTLHNVRFEYNHFTVSYKRINGSVLSDAHPRNVVIVEAPIESIGEYGRLKISLEGRGKALLFRSGKVQEAFWIKRNSESPFLFEDINGDDLTFAKGQTWMMVLPTLDRVSFE